MGNIIKISFLLITVLALSNCGKPNKGKKGATTGGGGSSSETGEVAKGDYTHFSAAVVTTTTTGQVVVDPATPIQHPQVIIANPLPENQQPYHPGQTTQQETTEDTGQTKNTGFSGQDCSREVGEGMSPTKIHEFPDSNLILHGHNYNTPGDPTSGLRNPMWSSVLIPGYNDRRAWFTTDSTLQLRVLGFPSPNQNEIDFWGLRCAFRPSRYDNLKIKIGIKSQSASYYNVGTFEFEPIPTNGCSKVLNVPADNIPPNSPSDPLEIHITEIQWDGSCIYARESTNSGSEWGKYCPYYQMWNTRCWQIKFQMATDSTKIFPSYLY